MYKKLEKLRNTLLYGGVDRSTYERISPKIMRYNNVMTSVLSCFATILIAAVFISSFHSDGIRQNRVVYEVGLALSVLTFALSASIARKHSALVMPLVYLSYGIYYMYGIFIGTITDPSNKTVTFIAMLVFMPILFISKPLHTFITTTIFVVIFMILCFMHKTGAILSVDTMDAAIFGLLGAATGSIINVDRVEKYRLESQLRDVSRFDQLTQMNNQNSFKLDLYSVPEKCHRSLACIYIDANGLHGLNNTKGHAEGDKMLQCIATQIVENFGKELSYRVGGDEFVIFVADPVREKLVKSIGAVISAVEAAGYSVAVGYEIGTVHHHFSVDELVEAADLRMQEDKRLYHSHNDR